MNTTAGISISRSVHRLRCLLHKILPCVRSFLCKLANLVDKGIDGIIFHNADGTSAESAAGDTGTIDTRNLPCQFSKNIGLRHRKSHSHHAEKYVRFIDQLSEGDDIICFQCFYCMDRSLVFVNCMFCPFLADRILDGILVGFEFSSLSDHQVF